jgi:coenzyme F420-dependent glucose-6-phosphate dehydrogenase
MLIERFEKGAREAGKDPATMPKIIQIKVSFAKTAEESLELAMKEWPNGGMPFPKGDIRNPEDFEAMGKLVRPENFKNRVLMSPDLDDHVKQIQHYIDTGFTEIYIHNVARTQAEFIDAYGRQVIPGLKWPS